MKTELKKQIEESIIRVRREKDLLVDLLQEAGIDTEDNPCEAMETLISASQELEDISL
jgi:hypothetical protein